MQSVCWSRALVCLCFCYIRKISSFQPRFMFVWTFNVWFKIFYVCFVRFYRDVLNVLTGKIWEFSRYLWTNYINVSETADNALSKRWISSKKLFSKIDWKLLQSAEECFIIEHIKQRRVLDRQPQPAYNRAFCRECWQCVCPACLTCLFAILFTGGPVLFMKVEKKVISHLNKCYSMSDLN